MRWSCYHVRDDTAAAVDDVFVDSSYFLAPSIESIYGAGLNGDAAPQRSAEFAESMQVGGRVGT